MRLGIRHFPEELVVVMRCYFRSFSLLLVFCSACLLTGCLLGDYKTITGELVLSERGFILLDNESRKNVPGWIRAKLEGIAQGQKAPFLDVNIVKNLWRSPATKQFLQKLKAIKAQVDQMPKLESEKPFARFTLNVSRNHPLQEWQCMAFDYQLIGEGDSRDE